MNFQNIKFEFFLPMSHFLQIFCFKLQENWLKSGELRLRGIINYIFWLLVCHWPSAILISSSRVAGVAVFVFSISFCACHFLTADLVRIVPYAEKYLMKNRVKSQLVLQRLLSTLSNFLLFCLEARQT